jgi:hypothetical protein
MINLSAKSLHKGATISQPELGVHKKICDIDLNLPLSQHHGEVRPLARTPGGSDVGKVLSSEHVHEVKSVTLTVKPSFGELIIIHGNTPS